MKFRIWTNKRKRKLLLLSCLSIALLLCTLAIGYASPTRVRFDIHQGAISAYFSAELVPSETQVELTPGSSKTISYTASSAPGEIKVEVFGHTGSQGFDTPIGTLSLPVFTVYGASVNVDITGRLAGTISISGPGWVDKQMLNWSGWGSQSLTLTVSPSAKAGETIQITLYPTYTVDIGASASIPIVGRQTIGSITAAELSGSPPITITVRVVQPKISEILPILLITIIIVVAVVIVAVGLRSRARKIKVPSPKLENVCPYCGTSLSPHARFCRNCGRRVGR